MMAKINCVEKIRALSEENRLKIIHLLMKSPSSVNEISEELGIAQYNASKHLRILEHADLILQKKEGQRRIYFLAQYISERLSKDKDKLALPCCVLDFRHLKF